MRPPVHRQPRSATRTRRVRKGWAGMAVSPALPAGRVEAALGRGRRRDRSDVAGVQAVTPGVSENAVMWHGNELSMFGSLPGHRGGARGRCADVDANRTILSRRRHYEPREPVVVLTPSVAEKLFGATVQIRREAGPHPPDAIHGRRAWSRKAQRIRIDGGRRSTRCTPRTPPCSSCSTSGAPPVHFGVR